MSQRFRSHVDHLVCSRRTTLIRTSLTLLGLILSANLAVAECDAIPGTDSLFRPGVAILLGEIHGTNEGPGAVAALACAAVNSGYPVTMGLEIPITEEERLDRYAASAGSPAARDSLIAGEFWQRDYQDGRGSAAMADLIVSLRHLGADTAADLHVLLIDDPSAPEGRDRFMADRLGTEMSERPERLYIVLTGNVHNRLTIGSAFDADYEPLGYLLWLENPDIDVLSLEMVHAGP